MPTSSLHLWKAELLGMIKCNMNEGDVVIGLLSNRADF